MGLIGPRKLIWSPEVVTSKDMTEHPLVILSPHLDDAVLSCAQVLMAHPGSVVITVFAGRPSDGRWSAWDHRCFRSGQDPMPLRWQEDRQALASIGSIPIHMRFLDVGYGISYVAGDLTTALGTELKKRRPESVLVPLGIFHSDHILVHEAAISLICGYSPQTRWVVYEELPYRFEYRELVESRLALLRNRGFQITESALPRSPSRRAKRRAVRKYSSQLSALGKTRLRCALGDERYWELVHE